MTAGLRLTVLGSAAAWTSRTGHASSCYMLEAGEEAIALDLGQGAFAALAANRDPASLRAVFVSHLHPDHGVDLVPLRHYLLYGCEPPATVELHAPSDIRRRYDVLAGESAFLAPLPGPPLTPGPRIVGRFEVTVMPVTHIEESYAFRVARHTHVAADPTSGRISAAAAEPADGGGSAHPGAGLVYSGDCGRWEDLVPLVHPGDTLLCEAFLGAGDPIPGLAHLTAFEAAHAARAGGAARLVLTHLRDGVDGETAVEAARSIFRGDVHLAAPGLRLTID